MIVFVVPVFSRHELATACLRQLRRVCDELDDATAVLVGSEQIFQQLADGLGFDWVYSPNEPLGRKWNDGIYHACTRMGADHIVRMGSDDVVHPSLFTEPPPAATIACTRNSAMVSPDGARLVSLRIKYEGGDGVQIVPRDVYEHLAFRPCLEDKHRAIDGSITQHLQLTGHAPRFDYRETDPLAIVDFKTATDDQRNTFASCLTFAVSERRDVFEAVADLHGELCAAEVAQVYGRTLVAA